MKLFNDKEDISTFFEILKEVETLKPIAKQIISSIESYASELKEPFEKISRWIVQNRIDSIKQYEAAGFSREDSILMTLDDIRAVRKVNENLSKIKHKNLAVWRNW